jgi:hypothetical protein
MKTQSIGGEIMQAVGQFEIELGTEEYAQAVEALFGVSYGSSQ